MSRDRRLKNKVNNHENCVTEMNDNIKSLASRSKIQHDKWESKQRFLVVHTDSKTTFYKRLNTGEKPKGLIHKGIICQKKIAN